MLSDRMTADIAVAALESAKSNRYVAETPYSGAIGAPNNASRALAEWARANDVRLSCSRTGNCYDNTVAESFFATLKNEMRYRASLATRAAAKHAVIELIVADCNRRSPPPRPSVTRCPRMPWSRYSSARSLNRSRFPLLPSSSIIHVRKLDTNYIDVSDTTTLSSIKDSSPTLALHRRFEVCRTLLLENFRPNAFLHIERNKQRQGSKQQQLQMWHSCPRRMLRQSQHKRG